MFQKMIAAFALITIGLIGASNPAYAQDAEGEMQKAVLVTGASTGIGRNIAETLAAEGYFVYAGARKQADLDALNDIENIQAVRLDVTKQDEIDAAVETVRAGGKGLYGLVNNAGVLTSGPLTEIDESDVAWVMDINVMGVYRVTKAFAPLIMESEGRITNISSIAGVLTAPFFGPYSMSKHAVEAYTDTLAEEMAQFNVTVSAVNPGNYRSKIGNKEAAAVAAQHYAQPGAPYAEAIAEHIKYMSDRSMHKEPDDVSSAVMHALFSESPKPNYMVVPNEEEAIWTIGRMIQEMAEFNADQEFTYSDEELIEMLQAATAAQRK